MWSSKNHNAKIIPPERRMSLDVRQCPQMSLNVLIKEKKDGNNLVKWWIIRIFMSSINNRKIPDNMFQPRPYGKAELALLYHPLSTPETAMKTLYRWMKGCPLLMAELEAMHYNPKRRTFLKPEVEAIVRHLGEP